MSDLRTDTPFSHLSNPSIFFRYFVHRNGWAWSDIQIGIAWTRRKHDYRAVEWKSGNIYGRHKSAPRTTRYHTVDQLKPALRASTGCTNVRICHCARKLGQGEPAYTKFLLMFQTLCLSTKLLHRRKDPVGKIYPRETDRKHRISEERGDP